MRGQTGTVQEFRGSWNSGLATLTIRHSDGTTQTVYCDNASTVRALDSIFGNVICEGHIINVEAIKGKKVRYGVDESGFVLVWIKGLKE